MSWRLILNSFQASQSIMFPTLVHPSKTATLNLHVVPPTQAIPSKAFKPPLRVLQSNTLNLLLTGFILPRFLSNSKMVNISNLIPMLQILSQMKIPPFLPSQLSSLPYPPDLRHLSIQGDISYLIFLTNMSSLNISMIFLHPLLACVTASLLVVVQLLSKILSMMSASSEATISRTLTELKLSSATPALFQTPGIAFSRIFTTTMNFSLGSITAGMSPFKASLLQKTLNKTTHLPCLIWKMWTTTSRRNWNLGHLSALFLKTSHSKSLSVLLAPFQRITAMSPELSLIAAREPLESTPGLMHTFIEVVTGKFASQPPNRSQPAFPKSVPGIQDVKSSFLKLISVATIDSGWSVQAKLHSLLSNGEITSILIGLLGLATEPPALVLREEVMPYLGSSGHRFLHHPINKILVQTVPAVPSVIVVKTFPILIVTISSESQPKNLPPTSSPCSFPSSKSLASSPPPPLATWFHPQISWLRWELSSTFPRTLYPYHKKNLTCTFPQFFILPPRISSPTRKSNLQPVSCFSAHESFTRESCISISSSMQKDVHSDSKKKFQLKPIFA